MLGTNCSSRNVTGSYPEGLSGEHSQLEAVLEASHDLMAAYLVVLSSALYDSGCGHTQSPALIACEVMFVEQRSGGPQDSSVWLVQQ